MEELSSIKERFDRFAQVYDLWVNHEDADPVTQACVDALAEIAGEGSALELGVGTGRVALPLAQRGVKVTGLDISPKMLERLHAKPGAGRLSVLVGNFADVEAPGCFDLIYAVWDTFHNLLTQEEQVRCVCNAKRKLTPGGALVIETSIPRDWIFGDGWTRSTIGVVFDYALERLVQTDLSQQFSDVRWIETSEQGTRIHRRQERFVWPSELDLMARVAGLRLEQRWSNWNKEPFTSQSRAQISVYRANGARTE